MTGPWPFKDVQSRRQAIVQTFVQYYFQYAKSKNI